MTSHSRLGLIMKADVRLLPLGALTIFLAALWLFFYQVPGYDIPNSYPVLGFQTGNFIIVGQGIDHAYVGGAIMILLPLLALAFNTDLTWVAIWVVIGGVFFFDGLVDILAGDYTNFWGVLLSVGIGVITAVLLSLSVRKGR